MKKRVSIVFALAGVLAQVCGLEAQAPPASADPRVMVESFYKIAPGKGDEWLEIYRSQHLPVLKERQRQRQILEITIYRPILHQGEPA